MQYRRDIDGLRAFAVLPVILFHAGFAPFSGGYIGVDIFFVISGYLITTIILRELEEGRFSLLRFYERRIRRILPALFVMMAICTPIAWVLLSPYMFRDFTQSLAAVSVYLSNVLFWRESGYFDTATELKPLLHTWSLAVEEQYYVIVPMLLMALWALGRWVLFGVIVALALASLALAHWMADIYPSANFYLLPSRAWELLAGSICAFLLTRGLRVSNDPLALLGLAMVVVPVFVFDADTPFPSLYTLIPVGGTALVILFTGPGSRMAKLLGWAPFVWIGLISYSAYLWHQPIFAFTRIHLIFEPSHELMAALSILSLAMGWVSWRFVERPFRNTRPSAPASQTTAPRAPWLASRVALFASAAAVSLVFVAIGGTPVANDLQRQAWRATRSPETLRTQALIAQTDQLARAAWNQESHAEKGCIFRISLGRRTIDYRLPEKDVARLRDCHTTHGPGVAILGDSHGRDLFGMVHAATDMPFTVGFTELDCSIHAPFRRCQYEAFADFLEANPEIFYTVLVGQAAFYLLEDAIGHDAPRDLFRRLPLDHRVPDYSPNLTGLEKVSGYLERLAPYAEVVWIGPRPEPHIPHEAMIRAGCSTPFALRENQFGPYRAMEQAIKERLDSGPVSFVSQIDAFDFDIARDFLTCETLYWTDGDHLSPAGQALFGPRLVEALNALPQFREAGLRLN